MNVVLCDDPRDHSAHGDCPGLINAAPEGPLKPSADKPYPDTLTRLRLRRLADPSGVSGTGVVAYGVRFPDGSVVLRWDTKVRSTVHYDSVDDLTTITSHGGSTVVEWLDEHDHYFNITAEGAWFVEHSDECRLSQTMGNCVFTSWALSASDEQYAWTPGRYKLQYDFEHGRMMTVTIMGA